MSLLRAAEGQALRSPATCVMQGAKSCGEKPENKVFSPTEDPSVGCFLPKRTLVDSKNQKG